MLEPPVIAGHIAELIRLAVAEDVGTGDRTTQLAIPGDGRVSAAVVARKPGVISGGFLLEPILAQYQSGEAVSCEVVSADGSRVTAGEIVAILKGPARIILPAERVLLNFLSHLSGIATLTRRYVDAVAPLAEKNGGKPAICDTRKTTPGFRVLDKYAVRCGGAVNHRMGLYDGVMLKDNHLAALRERFGEGGLGTLSLLAASIRASLDPAIPLWLEVDSLEQLAEALHAEGAGAGADIILLDNFTPDQMREAVVLRDQAGAYSKIKKQTAKILLEASGGITLDNIHDIASTGVDRISIGAITHSAPILDIAMDFA